MHCRVRLALRMARTPAHAVDVPPDTHPEAVFDVMGRIVNEGRGHWEWATHAHSSRLDALESSSGPDPVTVLHAEHPTVE